MNWQDDGAGVSADSLAYYRDHRHELGRIMQAVVTFPGLVGGDAYTVVLRDDRGTRLPLSGCAAGPAGDSHRTVMQLLVEAGFAPEIAAAVRTHDFVRMTRNPDGRTSLEQATGLPRPVASSPTVRPSGELPAPRGATARQQGHAR